MIKKKFDMNLISIISLGIGSVIGAGIFALLGEVIVLAGDKTYYAFIIAGTAAMLSGYSYAKLAGRYRTSGGLTEYFHVAFKSDWISGTLSLIYVLTSAISICMIAKSFGIYSLNLFADSNGNEFLINLFASLLIIGLALLNMMGANKVGNSETIFVAIKVFALIAVIVFALIQPQYKIEPILPISNNLDFMRSIGITFFAYAGYGVITNATPDVKKPKKTIAQGIYLTILTVMALYLALTYVVLNYATTAELKENAETAITAVTNKVMGQSGYFAIYIAAFVAFISGINATFFSIFRINKSLSQQNILPQFYQKTFWHDGTWGNVLTTALILAATILFDFSAIINLSSGAYLVSYLGIFAANWVLRKETKSSPLVIIIGTGLMVVILISFLVSLT